MGRHDGAARHIDREYPVRACLPIPRRRRTAVRRGAARSRSTSRLLRRASAHALKPCADGCVRMRPHATPHSTERVDERLEELSQRHRSAEENRIAMFYDSGRGYYPPSEAVKEREMFGLAFATVLRTSELLVIATSRSPCNRYRRFGLRTGTCGPRPGGGAAPYRRRAERRRVQLDRARRAPPPVAQPDGERRGARDHGPVAGPPEFGPPSMRVLPARDMGERRTDGVKARRRHTPGQIVRKLRRPTGCSPRAPRRPRSPRGSRSQRPPTTAGAPGYG